MFEYDQEADCRVNYVKGAMRLPDFVHPNSPAEAEVFKFAQNEFVHAIITTITSFQTTLAQPRLIGDSKSGYCALVFPSLSKWAMFITHAVLRELFKSLTAISVGPALHLRLVICHEDLIQKKIMKDLLAMEMKPKVGDADYAGDVQEDMANKPIGLEANDPASFISSIDSKLFAPNRLEPPISKDEEVLKAYQPSPDAAWTSLIAMHLTDILESIGPVWLMKPDWSRLEDVTDICPGFDSGEMDHALEIFDFPSTFVTEDLNQIFKEFEPRGFTIYWTDDTHAVIRFSSKDIATLALATIQHPSLQCRPVASASRQTKLMLARSAEKRLPFKRRPPTESNTAKRLILSSLGLQKPRRRADNES